MTRTLRSLFLVRPLRAAAMCGLLGALVAGPLACGSSSPPPVGETSGPSSAPPVETPREKAIRESAEAIRAECHRNAGGDWAKWQEQTAPYRTALKARIDAAKPFNPTAEGWFEGRSAVLEATDGFPLVEPAPAHYLPYLLDPAVHASYRKDQPAAVASRWLKKQGIDLLLVIIPKMTEVYPEHFAAPCPADKIVAPHARRSTLETLEAGVEVLDVLPLFLAERDKAPEPLYLPADPHWSPRAHAITAAAIASRLKRYDEIAQAAARPPILKAEPAPYPAFKEGAAFPALTPAQRERAEPAHPRTYSKVTTLDGGYPTAKASPYVVIGNSYSFYVKELLYKEINTVGVSRDSGGQTTEAFGDFLREPELLKGVKVVVWIHTSQLFPDFKPLPKPIRDADAATATQ